MIVIDIPGIPKGKARPRFGKGRVYSNPGTVARENEMGWIAKQAMHGQQPLTGPLYVKINAYLPVAITWNDKRIKQAVAQITRPTGKPDADNIIKTLDAFNKIVWKDDAQIVDLEIHKLYAMIPSMHIEVSEV